MLPLRHLAASARLILAAAVLFTSFVIYPAYHSGAHAADEPTVLITGSNRGLGFGFARQYALKGWNVIATARNPDTATELQELAAEYPNVSVERLDVTNEEDISALARKYEGKPIDVLLNNAAILGEVDDRTVTDLDFDELAQVLDVNTVGVLRVAAAFVDNVEMSDQKRIFAVTTGLGSMTTTGQMKGFYYYRISKAALNMAMVALNADVKDRGIVAGLISPGMVDTGMLEASGYQGPSLTPDESAAALIAIIDGYEADMTKTIYNYDGKVIPW